MSGGAAGTSGRLPGYLPLLLVLLGAAVLRLVSLDYSHFQGDEIKALFPAEAGFPDFLLQQRKGPIQFLVTLAVRLVTGGFEEWQTRLPFATASLLTVFATYLFVRQAFGPGPALWSAALVGSCGLLVAFGRIVQYQAFNMLFLTLSAVFLIRHARGGEPAWVFAGLGCYALALLSHYDALTFLPALTLLLAWPLARPENRRRPRLLPVLAASAATIGLVALFYIPYWLLSPFDQTRAYLIERVVAGQGWQTFTQTYDLLGLYLPPLYLYTLIALILAGMARLWRRRPGFEGWTLLLWFFGPFAFYMLLGGLPRSHVYMYVLPGLVLAALGVDALVSRWAEGRAVQIASAAGWSAIVAWGAITYFMLVDHTVEHPWERKSVLGYELPNLVTGRIEGVFGFPYRRGLEQVGALYRSGQLAGTFDSNERDAAVEYYFTALRSSPPLIYYDDPGSTAPDYYFFVHRPFSLRRDLPGAVGDTYRRIGTITEGGRVTIEMYAAPWISP